MQWLLLYPYKPKGQGIPCFLNYLSGIIGINVCNCRSEFKPGRSQGIYSVIVFRYLYTIFPDTSVKPSVGIKTQGWGSRS